MQMLIQSIILIFLSSGALYNYGVLKKKVRVLGGKEAFPSALVVRLLQEKVRGWWKLLPFVN